MSSKPPDCEAARDEELFEVSDDLTGVMDTFVSTAQTDAHEFPGGLTHG